MNKTQTVRLEAITAHFRALGNDAYDVTSASRFLNALAKSEVPLPEILAEMSGYQDQGYAVPAIRLGVVTAPRKGGCHMADVRAVTFAYTLADIKEIYGPKAHW